MRIGELLHEVRHTLGACDLCAFVDRDVELVLAVSAVNRPPQERLDTLAKLAVRLLAAIPEAPVPPCDPRTLPASGITTFLTHARTYILFPGSPDPSEVILCQCDPAVDPAAIEAAGALTFKWIKSAA